MAKKKTQAETESEESGFEESMEELEAIVRQLEQGGGALEQALTDYSKAITLLKNCHRRLAEAERKIELLSGVDAQGNPVTQDFAESSSSLQDKQESRSERRSAAATKTKGRSRTGDESGLF